MAQAGQIRCCSIRRTVGNLVLVHLRTMSRRSLLENQPIIDDFDGSRRRLSIMSSSLWICDWWSVKEPSWFSESLHQLAVLDWLLAQGKPFATTLSWRRPVANIAEGSTEEIYVSMECRGLITVVVQE